MELRTQRDPATGVPRDEIRDTAREDDPVASMASIWKCPNCGAQVQLIVGPDVAPAQPFTCVCGTPMVAGQEH